MGRAYISTRFLAPLAEGSAFNTEALGNGQSQTQSNRGDAYFFLRSLTGGARLATFLGAWRLDRVGWLESIDDVRLDLIGDDRSWRCFEINVSLVLNVITMSRDLQLS